MQIIPVLPLSDERVRLLGLKAKTLMENPRKASAFWTNAASFAFGSVEEQQQQNSVAA
jgi:hypothetical protein